MEIPPKSSAKVPSTSEVGRNRSFKELLDETFREILYRAEHPDINHFMTGLETDFYDLDYMTGGLKAGELIVLGGRPAMGTTSLALNLVMNVARLNSRPVVYVNMVLSRQALVYRMLVAEARVNAYRFKRGRLAEGDLPKVQAAIETLSALPIVLEDVSTRSAAGLMEYLLAKKTSEGISPCLVVVDDIRGLASMEENNADELFAFCQVCRQLKNLAMQLDTVVIAISNLNVSLEERDDRRPWLRDLPASDFVVGLADQVWFLYRDEYYDHETTERGLAELSIARSRTGPVGTIKLWFDKDHARFDNLAVPDVPPDENTNQGAE